MLIQDYQFRFTVDYVSVSCWLSTDMEDISFIETTSLIDETDLSMNVSIDYNDAGDPGDAGGDFESDEGHDVYRHSLQKSIIFL